MNGPFRKNAYVSPPPEKSYAKQMNKIAWDVTNATKRKADASTRENYGIAKDFILALAKKGERSVLLSGITKAFADKQIHYLAQTLISLLEEDEFQIYNPGCSNPGPIVKWQYK